MKNRERVFIQAYSSATRFSKAGWFNYREYDTYEDAVKAMNKLQRENPEARLRVLDNNLTTHTKGEH